MKNTGKTYRPQGNVGLLDNDEAIDKLNAMGNPLAKLADVIDFEMFREELTRKGLFDKLFDTFYRFLEEKGLIMKEGVIIDGSFVDVPRQRNTREENRQIKENKQTFKIKS